MTELELIILLLVLLIISAISAAVEIAFFSLGDLKVRHLAKKKVKNADILLKLKSKPHDVLISILIVNTLVNVSASAVAAVFIDNLFGNTGVTIATGVLTFIILVFGEITPKMIGQTYAKKLSLFFAKPLYFLITFLAPLIFLLDKMSKLFARFFGVDFATKQPMVTEDEIKNIVEVSSKEGSIKKMEREMIENIFEFDDIDVKEVMIPRKKMFALKGDMTIDEALPKIIHHNYSRIPVYDDDLDDIIGILYVKDLLKVFHNDRNMKIKKLLRTPIYVPDSKKINSMFDEFSKTKKHIAIVVDEHGTVLGLITMEDLVEQIMGDIYDETDDIHPQIKRLNKNTYMILGSTKLDLLNEKVGLNYDETVESDTLNGYILEKIGKIPYKNEKIRIDNFEFVVKVATDKEIVKLLAIKNLNFTPSDIGQAQESEVSYGEKKRRTKKAKK